MKTIQIKLEVDDTTNRPKTKGFCEVNGRESEYEIEGTTYRANVFTISPGHVSDLTATDTGFRCLAMFPPDSLNPRDRRKGKRLKSGAVQVSFEAARTKINGIQVETSPGSSEFESLYE